MRLFVVVLALSLGAHAQGLSIPPPTLQGVDVPPPVLEADLYSSLGLGGFSRATVSGLGTIGYVGPAVVLPATSGNGAIGGLSSDWMNRNAATGTVRRISVESFTGNGASAGDAAGALDALVEKHAAWYPPNYTPPEAFTTGNKKLGRSGPGPTRTIPWDWEEVTSLPITNNEDGQEGGLDAGWLHDLDGDGPLKPINMRAWVTRGTGESTVGMTKRLGRIVRAAMRRFPPNVSGTPQNPGGGG